MKTPGPSMADVVENKLFPGSEFHRPAFVQTAGVSWLITIKAERLAP